MCAGEPAADRLAGVPAAAQAAGVRSESRRYGGDWNRQGAIFGAVCWMSGSGWVQSYAAGQSTGRYRPEVAIRGEESPGDCGHSTLKMTGSVCHPIVDDTSNNRELAPLARIDLVCLEARRFRISSLERGSAKRSTGVTGRPRVYTLNAGHRPAAVNLL